VTNVAHQIGGSLGLAVLVAVFAAADGAGDLSGAGLLAHRIAASLTAGAILLALALVIAVAVRPRRPGALQVPTSAPPAATGVSAPEAETVLVERSSTCSMPAARAQRRYSDEQEQQDQSLPAIGCGTLGIPLAAQKTMKWFSGIDGTRWRAQQRPLAPSSRRHVEGAPASRDLRRNGRLDCGRALLLGGRTECPRRLVRGFRSGRAGSGDRARALSQCAKGSSAGRVWRLGSRCSYECRRRRTKVHALSTWGPVEASGAARPPYRFTYPHAYPPRKKALESSYFVGVLKTAGPDHPVPRVRIPPPPSGVESPHG
jgi:hypothetical protein